MLPAYVYPASTPREGEAGRQGDECCADPSDHPATPSAWGEGLPPPPPGGGGEAAGRMPGGGAALSARGERDRGPLTTGVGCKLKSFTFWKKFST
jgi:hypothetical protein